VSDKRRPGRPRSAEAERAILEATLALVTEVGLTRLSIEAVAARAGVGKATIYRRWSSKETLFRDAFATVTRELEPPPDRGSVVDEWDELLGDEAQSFAPRARMVLPLLLAEAAEDPELFEAVRGTLIAPRRAAARTVLERGVARGEIRDDVDLELLIDTLAGPLIYRSLIEGGHPEHLAHGARDVAELVLRGAAPR
jgi:AcrR family transcriptional regulator